MNTASVDCPQKARGSQKEGKCEQQQAARFEGTGCSGGRSGSDGQSILRPVSRKASSTSPAETRKSFGLFSIIGGPGLSPSASTLMSTGGSGGGGGRQREGSGTGSGSEKPSLCSFLSVGGGMPGSRSRSALDVRKLVEMEQSAHSSGSIGGKAGGAGSSTGSSRAGKAKEKLPVDLLSVARAAAATERALIAQSSSTLRRAHSKRERGSQGTLVALPGFAIAHMQPTEKAASAKSKERSSQSFRQKLSRRSKRRGKSNENRYERIWSNIVRTGVSVSTIGEYYTMHEYNVVDVNTGHHSMSM